MTGIHEHSAGYVCAACVDATTRPLQSSVRIEGDRFTTEEISAEQIEQARRAIARFHEIRRTMIALGAIDEDPAPSSTRVVDEGLLQRYEQELTDARTNSVVAARAANDMRRVFLSDKEIQNAESDPESWEIAVTRAGQIRDQLNDLGSPGLELMIAIEEVKRDNQTLKGELDRANSAVIELEEDRTAWKIRARQAERGQPKFSRPVSPPVEDTDAPVEDEDPLSPEERN